MFNSHHCPQPCRVVICLLKASPDFALRNLLNVKVRLCLHYPDAQWSYRYLHREEVAVCCMLHFWCVQNLMPVRMMFACQSGLLLQIFSHMYDMQGGLGRRLLVLGSLDDAPSNTVPLCVVSKHSSQVL